MGSYRNDSYNDFGWKTIQINSHRYIFPALLSVMKYLKILKDKVILDAGCGSGNIAFRLFSCGYQNIWAVDLSKKGIDLAKDKFKEIQDRFAIHDIYNPDLPGSLPQVYDVIISLELLEHLYDPQKYLKNTNLWLKEGGVLIISVPYHGYIKNLAISLLNRWDTHFDSLRVGRHIKFFSKNTIKRLLETNGFEIVKLCTAGRIPIFAKSIILAGRKTTA